MYAWMVSRMVTASFHRLSDGDPGPVLKMFGKGAHFEFPGDHSWALDSTDHDEIAAWFVRFAAEHPTFAIEDVVVKGPPWNTRVCTRGSDRIDLPDGQRYENRWFQFARVSWGRLREDRIYIDTQKVAALDRMLAGGR